MALGRRKLFADEEAIETQSQYGRSPPDSPRRKLFADEEAIETVWDTVVTIMLALSEAIR